RLAGLPRKPLDGHDPVQQPAQLLRRAERYRAGAGNSQGPLRQRDHASGFLGDHRAVWRPAVNAALRPAALATALFVAGCGGSSTPAPTATPTHSPTPAATAI